MNTTMRNHWIIRMNKQGKYRIGYLGFNTDAQALAVGRASGCGDGPLRDVLGKTYEIYCIDNDTDRTRLRRLSDDQYASGLWMLDLPAAPNEV